MQERRAPSRILLITTKVVLLVSCLAALIGAAPPASVTLVYFRGQYGQDGTHLEWQTATELSTAGFRLRRAPQASGPFVDLQEIGMVAGQGSATSGHTYNVIDETTTEGQTYWYRLVEVEYDNSEHDLETIGLFTGATPTATIEAIPTTGDGGDEPASTNTPPASPTATPSAPANATPTAQPTSAPPTNTPPPTLAALPTMNSDPAVEDEPRSVGNGGLAQAAEPTVLAQATAGYPQPQTTEPLPESDYPGPAETATSPQPAPTLGQPNLGYPPEASPPSNVAPFGVNPDNVVGGATSEPSAESSPAQSSTLGRVLLWVGFLAALLLFIAGVFFSIILSTRTRQRPDDFSQS